MKRQIFLICAMVASSAFAGVCDNSVINIRNNTDESLVLGNLNERGGRHNQFYHAGTATTYNQIEIQPNTEYSFKVSSAAGTGGQAYGTFSLGSDHGTHHFSYTFLPDGFIFKKCFSDSDVSNGNPKHYTIVQARKDEAPGKVLFTIKSRNNNLNHTIGG